jgi:hypothetical protein
LTFGKFKRKTLGELSATSAGRGYIAWLAQNVEKNAGKAARLLIALSQEGSAS